MIKTITIIGSGNVGFHLAQVLFQADYIIPQIFSRNLDKATVLAQKVSAQPIDNLSQLNTISDLYILAIPDQSIEVVAKTLHTLLPPSAFVVHTSGATSSEVFAPFFQRYGVFYPLQSFSITKAVDFSTLSICVHAQQAADLAALTSLGQDLSKNCYPIDDAQRATLHVAAVFANNFSNYLFHIAAQLLKESAIDFALLQPLIQETARKIAQHPPATMQTGPAIRGDQNTIQQHLSQLEDHQDWQAIYTLLSDGIQRDLGN